MELGGRGSSWFQTADSWSKAAKIRVQSSYHFSLKFWNITFVVAYRFLGWVTALHSKVRAQNKEESRSAAIHFYHGTKCGADRDFHREEMEAWKERCKLVGIAMFCFNLQKQQSQGTHKQDKDGGDHFEAPLSPTPPPWSEECPWFGDELW